MMKNLKTNIFEERVCHKETNHGTMLIPIPCFPKCEEGGFNSALLWQKEVSDTPSKSELLMFSYFA